MPPSVADDDHKRRARRRLIGAVALTIAAVIVLPLVLEGEPPPAGPLEVRMPVSAAEQIPPQNVGEFTPPPNSALEPAPLESVPVRDEGSKQVEPPKPAAAKPAVQAAKETPKPVSPSTVYAVQAGVFADKVNAERLRARIETLGLKPYSDTVGDSTRIRVGSFSNRAEAEALLAKLQAANIAGKVVEK